MNARNLVVAFALCVVSVDAAEIPEKAERYRAMLLRKPENPVLFGRMVDAWLEERELDGLKPELERRAREGGAADWRLLAVLHEHAGDEAAALKALDEAVKLAPEDPAGRLARGKALGAALRFESALEDLAIAAKAPETFLEAGTLRGKLLARAGRPAEAVEAWRELIAKNPADEGLKEDLIELEIGEGMLDEAIAAARELAAATEDPYKKALRRVQIAEILAQAGRKDESLKEYREVFAVSADGSWLEREVLAKAAALYAREDDMAGLKGFLAELRETYPRRVAVKKEAAKSLLAGGEEDEAIAMFREVLKVLPGDREVREEFIAVLEAAQRPKEAVEETMSLLQTAKGDTALWERLAVLKKQLGDAAGVEEAVKQAIATLAKDESGLVARARLWERFENFDEAEKGLREAVAAHGVAGESGEALAGFLVTRDKDEEAVALWGRMAAGADREGLLRIARSLAAHGKTSEAVGLLKPRMADFPNDALLLAAICQAAQLGDDPEAAVPHALELVRLAESPGDLETALRQATSLIARAEEPRKWTDQLAAKANPSIQELCLLSELHELVGDSLAAQKVLEQAMAGDESLLAATQRVRLHELRGAFEPAVAAMRELIALPGGAKTAHVKRLVELLERSGDMDGALEETASWLKIAPGDKLAWTKRAELYLGDGRPHEAVAELRRALAKFGTDEELRGKLADAQRDAGMTEEAWRAYSALYDEAESPAAKLKWVGILASIAMTEGKEEELVADFRRRSRDNPTSVLPLLALAEIYREWQNPDEEKSVVAEASRRKPDDSALKFRLADLEAHEGNSEASAAILRSMAGGPEGAEARRRLAAFWIREGEVERGLQELAVAGKGSDPRATEKLVMPLAVGKDWESLAKILAGEVAANPDDWRLRYFFAVALLEDGRKEEAFAHFVDLLDADGDLAGVQPVVQPAMRHALPQQVGKKPVISRKAIPMFRNFLHQISSHRNDHSYYGGGPGEVMLPAEVDHLRRMALLQAVTLCMEAEEGADAMLAKISSSHFDDLGALKRVVLLKEEDLKTVLMGRDATPDMFVWYLQFIQVAQQAQQREIRPDEEILQRGIEVCAAADPQTVIALMLWPGSSGGRNDIDPAKAATLLTIYKTLDEEKRSAMLHVLQRLAFGTAEIPDEVRKEAEQLLVAQLEQLPAQQSHWVSMSLPAMWMKSGRIEEAVAWMNRLHEEGKSKPDAARLQQMISSQRMMIHGRGWQPPGQEFPQLLSQLAPQIIQNLGGIRRAGTGLTDSHRKLLELIGPDPAQRPVQEQPVDPKAVAEHAPKINDRLSRIAIYYLAERTDDVEREMLEIGKAADAGVEELLLAVAYWNEVAKTPGKSLALLERAREAPGAGFWRDMIDQQLVAAGVAMADAGGQNLDLEPAKRAALRLRKQMTHDPGMRAAHANALAKLGLEEEGRRFAAGPVTAGRGRGTARMLGGIRYSRQGPSQPEDLAKLVGAGKRDAAARKVLADLRRMSGSSNSNYESSQLMEIVKSLKLEEEMIRQSTPPPDSGYARRKNHALLLMQLGNSAGALPWLRTLAEENPDDAVVRTTLYTALPEEEQKAQMKSMANGEIDTDALAALFSKWSEGPVAKRLEALEAMAALLEALEPSFDGKLNLSWINYFVKGIATTDHGEVQLSPLYSNGAAGSNTDKELSERRVELARRMFYSMLRHPQTSEQGFILLHGTREVLGTTVEELDRAALAGLRTAMKEEQVVSRNHYSDRRDGLWAWFRAGGSSSSGSPPRGSMPPETYLATRAAEGARLSVFGDGFLDELKQVNEKAATAFARCAEVVAAPGEAEIGKWKKELAERMPAAQREIRWMLELAAEAGRDDLQGEIRKIIVETLLTYSHQAVDLAGLLGQPVIDAKDLPARMAALHDLTKEILGPEEGWPLYGEIGDNVHVQSISQRLQAYRLFLQSLNGNSPAMVATARFTARHQMVSLAQFNWSGVISEQAGEKSGLDALLASGLLAAGPEPAAEFPNLAGDSMIGQLVMRFKSSDKAKDLAAELLKVKGDNRFWAQMIGAILAETPEAAYKELDRMAPVIAKWSAPAKADLSRFVSKWIPDAAGGTSGSMKRMLADSMKAETDESRRKAEAYLKDGLPPELVQNSHMQPVYPLISMLAPEDPELAARLWGKCLEQIRISRNGASSNGGFSMQQEGHAHDQLLGFMMKRRISLGHISNFLAALAKGESFQGFGMAVRNSQYDLRSLIQTYPRQLPAAIARNKAITSLPEDIRGFAGSVAAMARDADDSGSRVLAAFVLYHYLGNHGGNAKTSREALTPLASGDLLKASPVVSNSLLLGLLAKDAGNLDDAGKTALQSSYVKFASDQSIPADYRTLPWLLLMNSPAKDMLTDDASMQASANLLADHISRSPHWANIEIVRVMTALAEGNALDSGGAKRVLDAVVGSEIEYAGSGNNDENARSLVLSLELSLAIKAGDRESIADRVKQAAGSLRGKLNLALKLWQGGLGDSAVLLLARPGEFHQDVRTWLSGDAPRNEPVVHFSAAIESSLQGWLSGIEDPGQRYRIECLISALPDAVEADAPAVKRPERLAAVAKRFAAEAPKPNASKMEALAALATEPEQASSITGEYLAITRATDLGSVFLEQNMPSRGGGGQASIVQARVMEILIKQALRDPIVAAGDASELIRHIEALQISSAARRGSAQNMLSSIVYENASLLVRRIIELDGEAKAASAAHALKLSEVLLSFQDSNAQQHAVGLAIASQAAGGDGLKLERWIGSLSPEMKERYETVLKNSPLQSRFQILRLPPLSADAYESQRRSLLTSMLNDSITLAQAITHPTVLLELMDSGCFKRDEIFAVITALPEDHPQRAEFLTEKARIIGWRTDEDATPDYDLAEAVAKAKADPKTMAHVRAYRAAYMDSRQGKLKEALAIAKELDLDLLTGQERQLMENLLKKAPAKP